LTLHPLLRPWPRISSFSHTLFIPRISSRQRLLQVRPHVLLRPTQPTARECVKLLPLQQLQLEQLLEEQLKQVLPQSVVGRTEDSQNILKLYLAPLID